MTKAEEIYHRFVQYEWNEIGEGMKKSILDAINEALHQPPVSGRSLRSEFWRESADLIEKYRDNGDERAAQGVVSCRILIDRLMKQLDNAL
jgi:hypothetical protein